MPGGCTVGIDVADRRLLTSATQTRPAMAQAGLKARGLAEQELPASSAFHALTSERSALSAVSSTFSGRRRTGGFPALGHRAVAGAGEEGRDAGAARAQALGQRTLRVELGRARRQVLALELLVLADVGRNHLADLPGLSSWPRPKPSTPALLEMTVRFLTPESRSAAISASGMAQPEPAGEGQPSATGRRAQRASGYRLDVLIESSAPLVG